ncbi:enoyl-CoA hydratase/isomerase family protein [Thalassotalea sp. M1531]|uniref:Enoyl-CoA hydratase/isomerase family protein n=1 Tax=Thalassotalea algicola TaxID=2716224 RepID=A0A7Y0L9S8_9GAMM|nr:enoyl-CoA hydratase/isomerase family protein [Thalassotalea algicola]NMP30117.1 enoyl-CoA hydratase/isomerase family protein [Thalassotalea algicola]
MSTVELQVTGPVARLTIKRSEKYNALTQQMWQDIEQYCQTLRENANIRILVISAEGDKAFCSGADIQELTDIIRDESRLVKNNHLVQSVQQTIEQLPFATIAAINGLCFGGGMGIALSCDFRIAVDKAKFAITPAKLGLLYSIEDTRRVMNVIGSARTKEILFTGKILDAETAFNWGMVTQICTIDALSEQVEELVESLLAVSGQSIAGVKTTMGFIEQTNQAAEQEVRALFNEAFSSRDFKEGAQAFLEKRTPDFNQ